MENLAHPYHRVGIIESVDSISRDGPDSPLTQYITNGGISRAKYTITQFKHNHRVPQLISNRISVIVIHTLNFAQVKSMDDNCGEWVECIAWVWLVGVVSRRWVWLVGVGGIYGCGCKEVYRFPHTTYPYSSCICSFLQQHPYFLFIF